MSFRYGDTVKGRVTGRVGTFIRYAASQQAEVYWTSGEHYPLGTAVVSADGLEIVQEAKTAPKFKAGDRFIGRVSGKSGEVVFLKGRTYSGQDWEYAIRYDEPLHGGSRDSEGIESNLEPEPSTLDKFNEAVAANVAAEIEADKAHKVLRDAGTAHHAAQQAYNDARNAAQDAYEAVQEAMRNHLSSLVQAAES